MGKLSSIYRFSAGCLGALAGASLFQSCLPRGTDEATLYGSAAYANLRTVSFETLSTVILIPQCVKCHSEFVSQTGVNAQMIAGDPDHSPLYQRVADGSMPKGGVPLPSALVHVVRTYIQGQDPLASQPPIALGHVNFETLNQAIFTPRCLKCHDDFSSEDAVMEDVEPGDPEHSILYNYVASARMPKKGIALSDNYLAALREYIESAPPKFYPRIAPTWTSIHANLIQRSCIQCHTQGGRAEDEPFDTYADVVQYSAKILKKIQDDNKPMPPRQTTLPATPELIQAYSDWLKAGTPQN